MLKKNPAALPARGPVAPIFSGEDELRKGVAAMLLTNCLWALLPVYWKQLVHIPPFEVLCHRAFWGFLLVAVLLWRSNRFAEVKAVLRNKRLLLFVAGCSLSQSFAWGFYIWGVGAGYILDMALGNYMLPMCSVLCGFLIFRERPRRVQWAAIALAAFGVLGMIVWYGSFPWVGLLVAGNNVLFAVMRKRAPVDAMPGLVLELLISAPILWSYLAWLIISGNGVFLSVSVTQDLWLIGAGIVTIIPQMGYAYGLCRAPLTTVSLMLYLPPTGNFLVGLFLYGEPFTPDKVFGAVCIWLGLAVYTAESVYYHKTATTLAKSARAQKT